MINSIPNGQNTINIGITLLRRKRQIVGENTYPSNILIFTNIGVTMYLWIK